VDQFFFLPRCYIDIAADTTILGSILLLSTMLYRYRTDSRIDSTSCRDATSDIDGGVIRSKIEAVPQAAATNRGNPSSVSGSALLWI
jgi:hypothetical protein